MPKRPPSDRQLRWGEGRIREKPRRDRSPAFLALWPERLPSGEWGERGKQFETREEAEDHLRDVQRRKRDGRYEPPSETTVADLIDDYLARAAGRLTPRTILGYRRRADTMIVPHLGAKRAQSLTTLDVQRWIDLLGRATFKPATIHAAIAVLSGALTEATALGVLPRNVSAGTRRPSVKQPPITTWSEAEAKRLLAAVKDDPIYGVLYQVALATGMRPGELRALAWKDVDLETGRLTVRRTLSKDETGAEAIVERTKTHQPRAIALPAPLVKALRWHRAKQHERRLAHPAWQDLGLVFDRGDGHWMYQSGWQRAHRAFCEMAKVPVIRAHDLRHTSATLELDAGTPIQIVSNRLGHAKIQITIDRYQHVSEELQRGAADALGRRLFGDDEDATTSGQPEAKRAKSGP